MNTPREVSEDVPPLADFIGAERAVGVFARAADEVD
jgi:hypothetical protein